MPTSPLQETYLNGRERADELGSDINEYTRVLYGVSHVLKNRGFNYTVNDLSNLFHSPLASIRASEQIEQIIKAMDATFADGLKRGKDSHDTTKAIDISTISWRTNRLYSAQNHDPLNDVDGLISDFLKNKFQGIRRGTKQWKEESAKLADKALRMARDNKKNNINRELSEFKSWWDKDGQKLINTADREAEHTETQMKIIYALNPDSKAIQEAEEQIKSIRSRIINFRSSGDSSIKKAEDELHKLSEVQEIKKDLAKGETVEVPEKALKATTEKKSKYFITVSSEYEDRSGYRNVRQPVEKAYPFTYKDIDLFASKDISGKIWKITEAQTGLSIPGTGKTKEAAIQAVKETIDRMTPSKIKESISTGLKRLESEGIEYDNAPADRKESVDEAVERIKTEALKGALEDLGKNESVEVARKELPLSISGQDDETARFGEKVTVTADPDNPEIYPAYNGMIIRTLNKGNLIEVRPEGQTEGSFRVDASRVVPVQEIAEIKKELAKGETVEVPEPLISETVSGSGKQFIGKRAKHSEFGEVLIIWQNPAKNRALIQFDDGEKQETQMHKLRLLPPPEKKVPAAVKEEIKQGETVTIPEPVLKAEIAEIQQQETKGTYTYYFRNRPPDFGTHPGYAITTVSWIPKKETPNGSMAWGYVTYDHPLSSEELYNFELFVDDIEMPDELKDLIKLAHDEGIDEAMKEFNSAYGRMILNWMKANKRYPASRQKEAIRAELMQLAGITEKTQPEVAVVTKEQKQDLNAGKTVTIPAEAMESTPEKDWNYSLKKALKVMQDERKKTYPTTEAFRESRTKHADLLESDFHLKSHKDKAENYKPNTIQYNKHMAVYNERLEEIAEARKEAEAGKTIHELKLEETMRENDEQFAEKRSQEDIEHKRDERLRNTDTETLKQLAYTANIAWTNDKLSWKERHAAKDEGRAVLDILKERGIDISQDLIAKKLPDVKKIKQELTKGETVAIPESVLKATVSTEPNDIEKSKYTYPLSPEEIKENELSRGVEIRNIGGPSKLNSKGQVISSTDLGQIRLKNGKYYTEYQGKEGWVKGLTFDNFIHAHRYILDKSGYKPIIDIKKELAKGKAVEVLETVLKATIDTEPSAEVKEWFDKAHGIKDYKGGRNDRRSILGMLINAMPYGNVKSFNDMAKMARAIGKDLGYGEATSGTWERHFAEQIANETGRDVSIIGNAMVVHPGNKQSLKLPDGSLKLMSESKKPEASKKSVEEPKPEIEAKEKIDTGDAVLDELLESSESGYRAASNSILRPHARKYATELYNFFLKGGEEPEVPRMLLEHNKLVTEDHPKGIWKKAVAAAKKTQSLHKKEVSTVKTELSAGKSAVIPETILKKEIMSNAENQRRVDLMNERIKTERTLNVGVFRDGKLIKGGFKNAYDARIFMNDSFFTGSRANKINLLNPADFGWKVELIDEKTEILNIDELKQISKGATVTIPESALKAITKKELTFEEVGAIVEREMLGKRLSAKALKDYIEKKHGEGMPRGWVETHYLRVNPPTTIELEKEINKIEKQLEKTYHTVTSRAQATTREAQSGKLAQVLEGKKTQLKGIIEEKIVKGATAIVPEATISTLGKGTGISNYFTFDKAKRLITTMPATLSDSDLQKKSVIISDYIRLMESSDPYAREQLVKGGYWAGVADPGGTGKTPRDISMHTNLKYMQGLFDKELSVRKQKKEVTLGKTITVPESQLNPEFKGYGLFIKYTGSKDYRLMLSFPKENDAINAGYHYQSGKRELRNRITSWLVKDEKQNIVKLVTDGETQIIQTEIAKGKTIIKPESSAHIGALVTISGTKEEALRSFDRLLRRGQTIEVPQRNFIRLIEPPRLQIAAPAPSGTHAISVYSAPVIKSLNRGEVIDLPESSFRKIIDKPKPGRITGSKKQKPSCIPPVRVRAYDRGCPIKRR